MSLKKPLNDYGKYSSIAFQMILIILIGVFGGHFIDKYFEFKFPFLTIILSFSSVALAIYFVVKDLLNNK